MRPRDLSRTLNLRPETLSRVTTTLVNKGLLEREGKEIALARNPAAESFMRLYFAHRASPFEILIADRRVNLLSKIDNKQKSVEVLEEETGITRKTIYHYLKGFISTTSNAGACNISVTYLAGLSSGISSRQQTP